ncbi:hypothetical protein ACH347_24205 [Saccharopolyspora sp. 5N102]|uniref:hypothetical protein n=1 Tax=Saccharopolyspora sp. 5N102 TaxID=3375155 RepID=UPI00379DBA09
MAAIDAAMRSDEAVRLLQDELSRPGAPDAYAVSVVSKTSVQEIYKKRFRRPGFRPEKVIGWDRLLCDVDKCRGEILRLIAFSGRYHMFNIWLDGDASSLVAVTAGLHKGSMASE